MTHSPTLRTVLMLVPEGETHTLGAVVATGQLRRMGFSVCLRLGPSLHDVRSLLRSRVFDAAMISVGTGDRLEGSVKLVNTLRALGPRRMPVLAGGSSLRDPADLKDVTGVDFVTNDLSEAMRLCAFDLNYPTIDSAILQTHARQHA
jgi:methylmalonyl-CoA mutase cobalamin-binding subunit